jgi:predicted peptidase
MIHKTRKLSMEKDMLFVASFFIKENPSQTIYSCKTLQGLELLKSFVEHLNKVWTTSGSFIITPKQDYDLNRIIYTEYQLHYVDADNNSFNVNYKEFNYSKFGVRYREIKEKWLRNIVFETATNHFEEISSKYLAFVEKNNIAFSSDFFETKYDYIQIC